jgi:tetratricopeptide (TPR) repeat protein
MKIVISKIFALEDKLMTLYEISELIVSGFEKLTIYPGEEKSNYDACKGCDEMLLAWNELKLFMDESNISDFGELDKKQLKEFREYNIYPSFIFQLLQDELHNAGIEDKSYFEKRIEYCTEFQKYTGDDGLAIENTRGAIADSYFELGNEAECDRLYSEWLEADPEWGNGYVGWASNYEHGWHGRKNMGKAIGLCEKALGIDGVRDREDVIRQALRCYEEIGDKEKTDELSKELSQLQPEPPEHPTNHRHAPASSEKIGRNDPCPCRSGKKYKKCCGI